MNLNNQEKNTYARQQIIKSTIQLLEDKELSAISISEIANHSQISRVTIYRNFAEKDDIIKAYIYQLLGKWITEHAQATTREETDIMFARLLGTIQNNKTAFLLLQKRQLLSILREVLKELFGPKSQQDNFTAYVSAFYFAGLFGWVEEWIERGMVESAEIMEALLKSRVVE